MSYTLQLMAGNAATYVFVTPTPFTAPEYVYDYDDQQPPQLVQVHRTWSIEGIFYGVSTAPTPNSEANVFQAFNNLVTAIEGGTLTGAQFLHDTTVVLEVSKAAGYDSFKIEGLSSPQSELQWRDEVKIRIKLSATKKLSSPIAKLTQHETWNYDEAGLLTQTIDGEVVTPSGTSSVAEAKTLGLQLPSSSFGYVTNGPGGVDVDQVDRGDTVSRFRSQIRQVGQALPSGVGPSFSVATTTESEAGELVTTVTASARGVGALAAVQAQAPSGNFARSSVTYDPVQRAASAIYVQRKPANGNVRLKMQRFESRGGGRPTKWTKRTGGRSPIKHVGAFGPVGIRETIQIELMGAPGVNQFIYPGPVPGLDEDPSQLEFVGPERIVEGKDPSGDKWRLEIHRGYFDTNFEHAFSMIAIYALTPRASTNLTTPTEETTNQQEGTA